MKDMRTLARVILTGVALLVLLQYAIRFAAFLPYWLGNRDTVEITPNVISILLVIAMALAALYLCIYRPGILLKRIIQPDQNEPEIRCPVAFAFRLVAVVVGLLCLFWTAPLLVRIISELTANREHEFEGYRQLFTGSRGYLTWGYVGSAAIRLAAGIYLVCGAPHFVRWQVKKTMEQCAQTS